MTNVIEIVIKATDNATAAVSQVAKATKEAGAGFEQAAAAIEKSGVTYDKNAARANQLKLATLELAKTQQELANATDAMTRAQLQVKADKLTQEISELSAATDESANSAKKAEGGFTGFMNVLKAVGALAVAKKVLDTANELGNLALQADTAKARFEAFAGGARQAADVLSAVKAATGGALSEMDAMTASTKLMQMGLASSADEVATLTNMAIKLGDQTMSAGERVNDFALLLANQSVQRLDNFGISSSKVRQRIQELQEATPGLTREMAFMQATVEVGAQSLDKLATGVGSATMAAQQGRAAWADLKVEIGRSFSGGVMEAQGATGGLIRKFADLMKATNAVRSEVGFFRGTLAAAGDMMGLSGTLIDEYNNRLERQATTAERARLTGEAWARTLSKMDNEQLKVAASLGNSLNTWNQYNAAQQQAAESADAAAYKQAQLRDAIAAQDLAAATEGWNQVKAAMDGAVGDQAADYAGKMNDLRDALAENRAKVAELAAEQEKLAPGTQKYIDVSRQIHDLQGEYDGIIAKVQETAAAHEDATRRIVFGFLEQRMALDGLTAAEMVGLQEVANRFGLIDDATLAAIRGVDEVVSAMEAGTIAPEDLADKLGGVVDSALAVADSLSPAVTQMEAIAGIAPDSTAAIAAMGESAATAAPQIQTFDDGLTWIGQNGATTAGSLEALRDGFYGVNDAAMPAASSIQNAGSAANTAGGQLQTAAQRAAELSRDLKALVDRPWVVDVEYNIPNVPGQKGGQPSEPQPMASGFEGVFNRPTLALFGEAGPEYVKAVPQSSMMNSNNTYGGDTIIINNGAQAAMVMERKARTRALAGRF